MVSKAKIDPEHIDLSFIKYKYVEYYNYSVRNPLVFLQLWMAEAMPTLHYAPETFKMWSKAWLCSHLIILLSLRFYV